MFGRYTSIRALLVFGMIAGVFALPDALAQRERGITFSAETRMPVDGITFRAMRGATAVGLPQPVVQHYRMDTGETVERFLARDLWFPAAYRGRWQDAAGVELMLGVITPMLPTDSAARVTRDEFNQLMNDSGESWPADLEDLRQWILDFSGAEEVSSQRAVQRPPRLAEVLGFDIRSPDGDGAAYVFRFLQNVHGVDPNQWYIVVLRWPGVSERASVLRSVEQDFLGSLATMQRQEDMARLASDRFQHAELAQGVTRSPVYQESVERAINSVRGLPGWWYVETPNYVLVSDLSGGRRSFVQRLQADLEAMREIYEQMFPPRVPIEAVSLVRIFAAPEDYERYVGEAHRDTGGVWMPGKRELVIRVYDWGSELERRAQLAQIVYHEAFHQYIFYAFNLIETSPWYNEGHATFFEGADLRRADLRVDEVRNYADVLSGMASRGPLPLSRLLEMDYWDFYEHGTGNLVRRRENYAMAWGFIYYLRKSAPLDASNQYEQLVARYEAALWETRNMQEATKQTFAEVDMDALTIALTEFWKSDRHRHRAARNHDLL